MSRLKNIKLSDPTGLLIPVTDQTKCRIKINCINVCPYDVFEMKGLSDEDFNQLSFIGKMKTKFHGKAKAFVAKPNLCHACGLCLMSHPEEAINLLKINSL